MKSKVMVSHVNRKGVMVGTFVSVPIVMNGEPLQCIFFSGKRRLALVGVFDAKPRDVGAMWILESYTRRIVSIETIRDARKRANEALDELEPATERDPSFAFASDVASEVATVH